MKSHGPLINNNFLNFHNKQDCNSSEQPFTVKCSAVCSYLISKKHQSLKQKIAISISVKTLEGKCFRTIAWCTLQSNIVLLERNLYLIFSVSEIKYKCKKIYHDITLNDGFSGNVVPTSSLKQDKQELTLKFQAEY